MTRQDKIKLLIDLSTGQASIKDIPKSDGIDYSKFTDEELQRVVKNGEEHGDRPLEWPLEERKFLLKVIRDLPNRESWNHKKQNQ